MRHTHIFIVLFLIIGVAACSDGPTSSNSNDTSNPNDTSAFSGTNGFVINGDGFSNVVVNADSATATSIQFSVTHSTSVILYGQIDNQPFELAIGVVALGTTGSFNWTTANANVNAQLVITNYYTGGKSYKVGSGKTVIDKVGAVGETIEGSFEGTLISATDSSVLVTINGKFSAIRRK